MLIGKLACQRPLIVTQPTSVTIVVNPTASNFLKFILSHKWEGYLHDWKNQCATAQPHTSPAHISTCRLCICCRLEHATSIYEALR